MPRYINVDEKSEFFIAFAKEGMHFFLLSGVVVNGHPYLLAQFGNEGLIAKNFGSKSVPKYTLLTESIFSRTKASRVDAESSGAQYSSVDIIYKAYSMTYMQYLELIALTTVIHKEQLKRYTSRLDTSKQENEAGVLLVKEDVPIDFLHNIQCYVPIKQKSGKITFHFQQLDDIIFLESATDNPVQYEEIISRIKRITDSNTPQTTAFAMLNYILVCSKDAPSLFVLDCEFRSKLKRGKLQTDSFYILPPPPIAFPQTSSDQRHILQSYYKALENLPKNHHNDSETRKQFITLKNLYRIRSGVSQVSIVALLDKITAHRIVNNDILDKVIGQGIVSNFLIVSHQDTKNMQSAYLQMDKAVKTELDRLSQAKEQVARDCEQDKYQPETRRSPVAKWFI